MSNKKGAAIGLIAVLILVALYGSYLRGLSGFGSGRGHDCTLTTGPKNGEIVMRAECDWPFSVDQVHNMLRAVGDHDRYFANLGESSVLEERDGFLRVRQIHQARGIDDREVVVDWVITPIDGGYRYAWRKSKDQSAVSGTRIEVEVHEGMWEITSTPTGTHVVYDMRYLPGGSVPAFLVRWFQASSVENVLAEARAAAEQEAATIASGSAAAS
jgi:hypothetical protein